MWAVRFLPWVPYFAGGAGFGVRLRLTLGLWITRVVSASHPAA